MKIFIFKILGFLIVAITVMIICEKYFIKEDRYNNSYFLFNKISETENIDIVFFGSSKSYCSYSPTIFKNNLGVNCFNLAGQGQVLEVTNFIIDEALSKTKPELIVVDISYNMIVFNSNDSLSKKAKSFQLKIFDNYGFSFNKYRYIKKIYEPKDAVYAISPLIRNHEKWHEIPQKYYKKEFLEERNNLFLFNNGYIGTFHNLDESGRTIARDVDQGYEKLKNTSNLKLNEKELQVIKNIHDKATLKGIKVLFVTAPSIKGFVRHLSFYEDVERLCKINNIDYLNLNKYYKDINLTTNDFKDIQHMNYSGGFKTSQFLSKLISKRYSFRSISKVNELDNNVTFHLLTHLRNTNKLLNTEFQFSETIKIKEIGYFKETDKRFSFIFKLNNELNLKQVENYRGYIRFYNGEIKEENKVVNSFPMKFIKVENELYIFARINVENVNLSKLDIFFMKKGTSDASFFFTLNDLKLQDNAN